MNAESSPNRRFGGLNISRGQVQLRFSLIRQWNVGFDEELAAGESSALAQAGLGPLGPGDGDPHVALLLAERPPAGGDSTETVADRDLGGAAGIKRDKGGVADLAVAIALTDNTHALARFGVGHFHN